MTSTCPNGWTFAHNCPTQPAPDLSDYERATVERIEAAPAAEESLRERVAAKLSTLTTCHGDEWPSEFHYEQADVAIAVMRGEL